MSLLTNLISYWKLDEASGDALDAHGANPLTQTGSVGTAAGKVGTARDFSALTGAYFSHADNVDLSTGDIDFTIACWVQAGVTPPGYAYIASKGWYSGTPEWQLFHYPNDFYFRVQNSAGGSGLSSRVSGP